MTSSVRVAPWPVLIVDDDDDVHKATELVLRDFSFNGRPLELVNATSAGEARKILEARDDFALALLDVVMESDNAGLELVRHIREKLRNDLIRIVLRTGQPGQAPESRVVDDYDINGYHAKSGTTAQDLKTLIKTALRGYDLLNRLEERERELRISNRELERFAFTASHGFQTHLRNVLRLTRLLINRAGDSLDHESSELLLMLSDSATNLYQLTDDLLGYARINAPDPALTEVPLDDALARALSRLRIEIDERRAKIDSASLPSVRGHAGLLEQLLHNLVDNAIRYQPGEAPKVEIRSDAEPNGHRLQVIDHGIGIPKEHRRSVLDMYTRLHTEDEYPGSGIGLAACNRIVEIHGGALEIGDTPGGGTTVSVLLPSGARGA